MFWIYYVLPLFGLSLPALLAGVLALGMNFGAYGAEVFRAGILAVPKGQWEGALALNFSKTKRMQRIIIPQIYNYLKNQYGEWIVYDPEFNKKNLILWVFPLILFISGGLLIYRKVFIN